MIIAKIILWTLLVVQIGLLIGLIVMGVRMFRAERRRRMKESVAHAEHPNTHNAPPTTCCKRGSSSSTASPTIELC